MRRPRKRRALRGPLRVKQAHLWRRAKSDWYVEPLWCAVRLFHVEAFDGTITDPCCGLGRTVQAAQMLGLRVRGVDLVDRGGITKPPGRTEDFLCTRERRRHFVFNPPFGRAYEFVVHALSLAEGKVAVLLPAGWHQAEERYDWIVGTPLARIWFLAPRPSMPPGHVVQRGGKPGNGTTDYAWFVWEHGHVGPWTGHTLTRTPRVMPAKPFVSREKLL